MRQRHVLSTFAHYVSCMPDAENNKAEKRWLMKRDDPEFSLEAWFLEKKMVDVFCLIASARIGAG